MTRRCPPRVVLEAVPPERRKRSVTVAAHGCCCCCVHSIGSLLGAALACRRPFKDPPDEASMDEEVAAEKRRWRRQPVWLYWNSLALSILVTVACTSFSVPAVDRLTWILIGGAFFFPLIQLGASVLALLWILLSKQPDKIGACFTLGKITGWTVIGTIAGALGDMLLLAF